MNFRSKKKDVSTLNVKNNNSSHSTAKETTNESDPKVLYLPNITTNIEDVNVPNVSNQYGISMNLFLMINLNSR